MSQKIVTNLWFDTQAEEAAAFYCSVFPDSRITSVSRYTEAGPREPGSVMTVEWELDGQRFVGINGGPDFTFNEAVSLQIVCEDQEEIDHYWDALTDGGEELPCGWLKDRYGLAWQVTPRVLDELVARGGEESRRAMEAMFTMKRLDIEALRRAAADAEARA